ncbi:MAG: NAD(P)H-quinone oxidoreductase [Vulcanimicrobiaceae bacterium]
MKYIAFAQPGPPSVLYVADGPQPIPAAGEVLIDVEAAGVCRADALQRAGSYPPPPGASPVLGLEVAGTVCAVGVDTGGVHIGDRVVALCNGGGYAQYVSVPYGQVLPLPQSWSFIEGASLPENAFTVFDNVFTRAHLQAGETLLVHGGSSGIGTTAIMFARALGARAIATAGTDAKCAACIEYGANAAINYRTHDFVQEVQSLTEGRGADVILDIVGGDYIARDIACLATDGRIVCIATSGGSSATFDIGMLMRKRGTLMASSLRARSTAEKAAIGRGLRDRIWPLLAARMAIVPAIDSLHTFSDAARAHERLESSRHIGKIILVPDASPPDEAVSQEEERKAPKSP